MARKHRDIIKVTDSVATINRKQYCFSDLQQYLLCEWGVVTRKYFIRWIMTKDGLTSKYDWTALVEDISNSFYPIHCFLQTATPITKKP